MKVSEITLADVKNRLRIDYDTDDGQLPPIMAAAKAMMRDMTGRTDAEIDGFEQGYHLFMCICQHMYDNNELTVQAGDLDHACRVIINQMKTAEVVMA
ncbi:MAG: phage gp6-like head-tail connector protein [Oscillospiraceae bacterium]|nr:phage gp6-like head-tail connector protein [Oscillospiraceae bacterium]